MICTYNYNSATQSYYRRRRIILKDATVSGDHPYLYPQRIRFGGSGSLYSCVEPHLPDESGICAYYETDCWTDRLVSFDPSVGSGETVTGLTIDTNAAGLQSFYNAPHFCITSTDSSTTKIKGPLYDNIDPYLHRRTATSDNNGKTINGFRIDEHADFYVSEVAVVACYNCTPTFFIDQSSYYSSATPTTVQYQYGWDVSSNKILQTNGVVTLAGTKTYSNRDWKIYVVACIPQKCSSDNGNYFISNPCIGFNVDDFTQTLSSVHLMHACKEFAYRNIG